MAPSRSRRRRWLPNVEAGHAASPFASIWAAISPTGPPDAGIIGVTEFSILRTLAAMPARVFSRDAIIDRLHGPGFAVADRTIDSHVSNLRAKFAEAGGTDLIETRPGIGYRLGACVGATP